MEKLQEIKSKLTNNLIEDLKILQGYLKITTKTEEEFFDKVEICKYMKQLCQDNELLFKMYHESFEQMDLEFFKYIYSKINIKHSKKQWEKMLVYVNKAKWYFNLPQNEISFDAIEDYYLYNIIFEKLNAESEFKMGIESWVYYEQANVYKNLGELDFAIDSLYHSIKCSPMNFSYYEQLFICLIKAKRFEELKLNLQKCHTIIKNPQHLAVFYYFYAQYFYNINNLSMTKVLCYFANKFNVPLIYRPKLLDLFDKINNQKNVIMPNFNIEPKGILIKNNIPTTYSKIMRLAMVELYGNCLNKFVEDKTVLKFSREALVKFGMIHYAEEQKTNILTNERMYRFDRFKFSLKLNKTWQPILNESKSNINEGILFTAINKDETLTVFISKNENNLTLDEFYKKSMEKLELCDNICLNETQFTTMKGKDVKFSILKLNGGNKILSAAFELEDNQLCNITMAVEGDIKPKKASFFRVLNSVEPFYSINHQDN